MLKIDEVHSVADYRRFVEWIKSDPCTRKRFTHSRNSKSAKATDAFQENEQISFSTYDELLGLISFLTSMNRRQSLFYRVQVKRHETIMPSLLRLKWNSPIGEIELTDKRERVFQRLCCLHIDVAKQVTSLGVPREATLFGIREATWAILQHYELWPRPLIDITASMHVALSFALDLGAKQDGYLYVIGLPALHGSVTHHVDQHLVIAQLKSICPPCAMRPHRQDSLLVGRHPFYGFGRGDDNEKPSKNDLACRTVATIHIDNTSDGFRSAMLATEQKDFLLIEDELQLLLTEYFHQHRIWEELRG
jgi:hypothetical protein